MTLLKYKCRVVHFRAKRFADYGGSCGSESEVWSEPDRCASLARIGLSKESMAGTNQCSETETSDLEDISKLKLSGKKKFIEI